MGLLVCTWLITHHVHTISRGDAYLLKCFVCFVTVLQQSWLLRIHPRTLWVPPRTPWTAWHEGLYERYLPLQRSTEIGLKKWITHVREKCQNWKYELQRYRYIHVLLLLFINHQSRGTLLRLIFDSKGSELCVLLIINVFTKALFEQMVTFFGLSERTYNGAWIRYMLVV